MSGATRLTWMLSALVVLGTFGEGGGSVVGLLVWHAAVLVIVLVVLLAPDVRTPWPRPHPLLAPAGFAFGMLVVAGALRAPYAYGAWLVVVELAAWTAVFVLAAATRRELPRTLLPLLLAFAALHATFVLYQAAWLGRSRPAGTFLNTNHMSAWLVMALLFAAPWWLAATRRVRWGAALLAVPVLGALVVSASRGAMLGAAAGGTWLLLAHWKMLGRRSRTALVVAGIVAGALIGWRQFERVGDDPFIHHRPLIWRSSLAVLAEDPLWGSGPGQFAVAAARHRFDDAHGPLRFDRTFRATHSDWLRVPVEFGIPAALALAGVLAAALFVVARRGQGGTWTVQDDGALAALLALAAQAVVDNPSRWPAAGLFAAVLSGRLLSTRPEYGKARIAWPARAATAVVLFVLFLAIEVAPTLAWARVRRPDADTAQWLAATRLNPVHPGYWSRVAERTFAVPPPASGSAFLERYGDARECAERAVRLQPADARYRLTLADVEARACLARFRDTACRGRVLDHFQAAAARSPFDATIPLQAAEFARRAGDPATSRRLVERALRLEPNAVPARLLLAESLLAPPGEAGSRNAAEARRLVDEAEELALRHRAAAGKSGYARMLLGFDAARAVDLRRRAAAAVPATDGRAAGPPKRLTYARGGRPGPAMTGH